MAKYALECPSCLARFALRKVVPGKRVRCRKCRSVIIIPEPEGPAEPKKLDPRLRRKLAGSLSLTRLIVAAALLVLALGAGLFLLITGRRPRMEKPEPPRIPKLTLKDMKAVNRRVVFPLGRGYAWDYALSGGGTEQRRVASETSGAEGAPEYGMAITGGTHEGHLMLRVLGDGVYLVCVVTREGRAPFKPPMKLVPYPMYLEDRWSYEGGWDRPGGGFEPWKLDFEVRGVERIACDAGSFVCFRLEVNGERGAQGFSETLWYAIGVGLVKRRTEADGKVEEAILTKRSVEQSNR